MESDMVSTVDNAASVAQSALCASPIYLLRQIRVQEINDAIYLRGTVNTFYHKQLAQELVRAVCDGAQVVNEVAVD